MATNESKEPTTAAAKLADTVTAPAAAAEAAGAEAVEVVRKKKRKYSRGTRSIQEFERGVSRASRDIGKAVAKGLAVYVDRREASSRKKRDGAMLDMVNNVGKAVGKGIKRGADAPYEFAKAINTKRFSKQVRSAVRIMLPTSFF